MVGDRNTPKVNVPLFVPEPRHLRAGAIWVEIANWAEAIAARYGEACVVTPSGSMTSEEARSAAWSSNATRVAGDESSGPRSPFEQMSRLAAKDARSAVWAARSGFATRRREMQPFVGTPYVWQHHDLFQRTGFIAARRLDTPVVLFVDAPQVWEAERWGVVRPGWGRLVERFGEVPQFSDAAVVACVSEEVAEEVESLTRGRAAVLVTPSTAAAPSASFRDDHRSRYALTGRFVVGWVGSFRPFHHVDFLVRSVAELSAAVPNVTLVLIGDGPTRRDAESLAAELGVDLRSVGRVDNADVVGLLEACDVGVVPARQGDAFHYSPLKLKEYMAAGLPTVVPRVGEMERVLADGVEALFYEPGDQLAIVANLNALVVDEQRRVRMGKAARTQLEKSFSMAGQIDAVEAALAACGQLRWQCNG